jgi:hypothetical protein
VIVKKYISELLQSNDCVIVPGFGAFIKHYESASVHPITHKFSPPTTIIGFNGSLRLNDNLLQKHIAVGEQCEDQAALHQIQFFIHSLKQHINQFGFFEFEHLGRFFLNKEGLLQFESEVSNYFSDDTFGLSEFIVKPIDRNTYAMTTNHTKKSKEQLDGEVPKKSNALKVVLIAASVLVVLATAGFFVLLEQPNQSIAGINFKELLGLEDEKASVQVDSSALVEAVDSTASTSSEYYSDDASVSEDASTSNNSNFYVVIGSFQNNTYAQNYSDKLNNKGLSTTVISGDNGYYRVAVDASADKKQALKKRKELIAQYGSSIWLVQQ